MDASDLSLQAPRLPLFTSPWDWHLLPEALWRETAPSAGAEAPARLECRPLCNIVDYARLPTLELSASRDPSPFRTGGGTLGGGAREPQVRPFYLPLCRYLIIRLCSHIPRLPLYYTDLPFSLKFQKVKQYSEKSIDFSFEFYLFCFVYHLQATKSWAS